MQPQGDLGPKVSRSIRGWLQLAALPFTIAAPVLVGAMADRQGTYRWAFVIMASVMLMGAGLVFFAARSKAPSDGRHVLPTGT